MNLITPFSITLLIFALPLLGHSQTTTTPTSSTKNNLEREAYIQTMRQENYNKFQDSLKSMSEMDLLHEEVKNWEKEDSFNASGDFSSEEENSAIQAEDDYLKEHWKMKESREWKEELKKSPQNENYQTPEF